MKQCVCILLLVSCCRMVVAQSYNFRHYQVENGLSNNAVICSVRDRQGFLWFGTKDGLDRFDGYAFKIFRHNQEDKRSIGNNFIQSLHEDEQGIIWVGTGGGLYAYDPVKENFSLIGGTAEYAVYSIKTDRAGNLWFITTATLCRLDLRTRALTRYDSRAWFKAASICLTEDGGLWIATFSGSLKRYDPRHDSFQEVRVVQAVSSSQPARSAQPAQQQMRNPGLKDTSSTDEKLIEKIYPTGKGSILIGTPSHGMRLFDLATHACKEVISYNPDKTAIYVRDFIRVSADEYWVATESGIFIYNITTGGLTNLRKQYNDPFSLTDNAVYTLCQDSQKGIWAGTYFGGVNYYQDIPFEKFFPRTGENSLSGNAVREICRDRAGNLWIGTEDAGLNEIKAGTDSFVHYKPTGRPGSIAYSNIHGLLADGDTLWIGTFENGLDLMNIHTGRVIRHYSVGVTPGSLKSNFIYTIFRTRGGDILIGTGAGLYLYNRRKGDFLPIANIPSDSFVASIYEDSKGVIWVGTFREGVYYYDPRTGNNGNYRYMAADTNSLAGNRVNGILEDEGHRLWFATEDGLSRYDPKTKAFRTYTAKNGLPSDVIYRSLQDGKGNLWISTSKGLVCFNPANGEMQTFTTAGGLLSDQFNYNSAFKDTDGMMYFGSVKGMISFKPDEYIQTFSTPTVYITGFQVYNKELAVGRKGSPLQNSITYTPRITLDFNQSSFSIDFAALNFTAPEMTKYMYKMEGLDKDWTYLQSNRKVYFTELTPGNYTFMVKASQTGYSWNGSPTMLAIRILPPFWLSPWAYILYGLLIITGILAGIHAYHRRIQEKNRRRLQFLESEKEKEIYHAKIEFFTNVAHEIRTPLTLIKLPLEKTIRLAGANPELMQNLAIMEKNTDRLIDLTNQLLDFRKTESKGLTLNFVKSDINDLLIDLFQAFKPAAEQKNMNCKLELPKMHFQAYVDTDAFKKIVSNLLSNAIKYGKDEVRISILPFSSEDETFTIRVVNNGVLIPGDMMEKIFEPFFRLKDTQKQPGTGIGLALSRSLAQLHQGSLIATTSDRLNVFLLTLPVHQDQQFELYDDTFARESAAAGALESADTRHKDDGATGEDGAVHGDRTTILLVEDNKEILDFIAGELHHEYRIMKAYNGNDAINRLRDEVVQLVISDIMMPGMNGLELCKAIKSNFEYSHIPVILLTAKNTLQSKIEGLEQGADAYIEKPFSSQHLIAQITSLLSNRNRIKEYFASSPMVHIKTMAWSKEDEAFLLSIQDIISENLEHFDFNVEHLARIMNMSRPTLYRKIKALSNLTPNELINITRLKKGLELLAEGRYKIYEVADMLGYTLQANFSRDFAKQFGMSPSEYVQSKRMERKGG